MTAVSRSAFSRTSQPATDLWTNFSTGMFFFCIGIGNRKNPSRLRRKRSHWDQIMADHQFQLLICGSCSQLISLKTPGRQKHILTERCTADKNRHDLSSGGCCFSDFPPDRSPLFHHYVNTSFQLGQCFRAFFRTAGKGTISLSVPALGIPGGSSFFAEGVENERLLCYSLSSYEKC